MSHRLRTLRSVAKSPPTVHSDLLYGASPVCPATKSRYRIDASILSRIVGGDFPINLLAGDTSHPGLSIHHLRLSPLSRLPFSLCLLISRSRAKSAGARAQLESHYVSAGDAPVLIVQQTLASGGRIPAEFLHLLAGGVDGCPAIRCRDPRPPLNSSARQLPDIFPLTRGHHRAHRPPAVSFSCLDGDVETCPKERSRHSPIHSATSRGPDPRGN